MSTTSAAILYLGLDVHKESVVSAVQPDDAVPPRQVDTLPYDLGRLKRYLDRLARDGAELRCVYEASGAGYVLQRAIQSWGYHCDICAPSLTPRRPGHQRKHNRYDAKELARYYRNGELVVIAIPTEAEERTRDLVRCRTTMQRQLHRARQFVLKFLPPPRAALRAGGGQGLPLDEGASRLARGAARGPGARPGGPDRAGRIPGPDALHRAAAGRARPTARGDGAPAGPRRGGRDAGGVPRPRVPRGAGVRQ